MIGHYEHTPYIWPMLLSPALLLALGAYAWKQRPAPGALPFVALVLCFVPWALGAALEPSTRPDTRRAARTPRSSIRECGTRLRVAGEESQKRVADPASRARPMTSRVPESHRRALILGPPAGYSTSIFSSSTGTGQ